MPSTHPPATQTHKHTIYGCNRRQKGFTRQPDANGTRTNDGHPERRDESTNKTMQQDGGMKGHNKEEMRVMKCNKPFACGVATMLSLLVRRQ